MESLPRSDPDRAFYIQNLARAKITRHGLWGQQDDLEGSILCFTEAIFFPRSWGSFPPYLNIAQEFYELTGAVMRRAIEFRQPNDVKCCVVYLRYLHGQCHGALDDPQFIITALLVYVMEIQVELELEDVDQDIEQMADLCDELLNSDTSKDFLTPFVGSFTRALLVPLREPFKGQIPFEKVIGCLRKVTVHLPDFHEASLILGLSLLIRFQMTISEDYYEEGMAVLDKVINFRDLGGRPSPDYDDALLVTFAFCLLHFCLYGKPEHLEQAIYRLRTALDRTPLEGYNRPLLIHYLSGLQGLRYYDPNAEEIAPDALFSTTESTRPPSLQDLIADLPRLKAIPFVPGTGADSHFRALHLLASSVNRLTDIVEIEDGIKYCQELLASYPGRQVSRHAQSLITHLFHRAFECTNQIEYLNKAISAARDRVSSPNAQGRISSLMELTGLLSKRLSLLDHRGDLNELMELFPEAAKNEFGRLPHYGLVSIRWASTAHHFGHPSASTAYDLAMSSMQFDLTLAPTLDKQHSRLIVMRNDLKVLPLDFASYQIGTGQPKQAIETLERGRALLWSEMRGLRTTADQIRSADCHLGEKFASVSRDLEALTLALDNVDGGNSIPKGMDPFGHLVMRQQRLLDEREKLVLKIRALPGLDTFLKPHSYDTLCGAARHGPIIIINHSEWRSDIVILLHNSPPSLITTSDDFYSRANKLQDRLLGERRQPADLESNDYDDALSNVLNELYELVGRPVIKRLNELNVPLQSRVWWCPTSVFCSLPLHAMGPIPSDRRRPQYFLDLYIPSYIPSLLSLIESRNSGSQTFDEPSMLVVAQPDVNMIQALEEVRVVQAVSPRVTTLIAAAATPPAVLERIRDHRFTHIVCHGILEPGKPLDSGFKLYKGHRLSLLDVVRSRLPNAEFAFLSACHTAELTDQSPADEVLHLAAAMQFCGFRSVVGTMWAMADADGPALAGDFYKSVFSGRRQGTPYYERTAEALRDAVVKLRRKRGVGLERWVNYVHFGA